jgi:regulatory protein
MQKKREQPSLLQYALWLLGRQRYTRSGIRQKLMEMSKKKSPVTGSQSDSQIAEEEISAVIERLEDYGYINDKQYAEFYIHDQLLRKPQGIRLLKRNMAGKGLSKEIILKSLGRNADTSAEKEIEFAMLAAKRKLKSLEKNPPEKKREKLARFLFSRGFGTDTVLQILKEENLYKTSST